MSERGGPKSKGQASCAEGSEFEPPPSQSNDLENVYLSLPSQALGITKTGQGLVSSISG